MNSSSIYKMGSIIALLLLMVVGVSLYQLSRDHMADINKVAGIKADLEFLLPQNFKTTRDPFQYIEKKKAATKTVKQPKQAEIKQPHKVVIPEVKKGPLAGFEYVGMMVKGGKSKAFVLVQEKRHVVTVGDTIANRFRVIEINREYIKLKQQPNGKTYPLYAGKGE